MDQITNVTKVLKVDGEIQSSIILGKSYFDIISGFKGIAIGLTTWLFGCVRVGLSSTKLDSNGKVMDAQWFDEGQLCEVDVEKNVNVSIPSGGPRDVEFKRLPDPER